MKYKYKYKNRPLRLLKDKNNLPYIKYKNKNISLKGYNIDEIIKIIKKLTKQTKKKKLEPQEQKKKKEQINKFLNDVSTSSSISVVDGKTIPVIQGSIKEDTQKIKELSDEIQIYKSKVLSVNNSSGDIEKKIKNINKNIKSIENIKNSKQKFKDFLNYDENTDRYSIDFKDLGIIYGNSPDELKEGIIQLYKNSIDEKKQLENDKQSIEDEKKQLENEKKSIEDEKKKLESLSKLQKKSLNIKQKQLNKKEKELKRERRYIDYFNKTVKDLNKDARNIFNGLDQDKTKEFNELFNKFYNLPDDEKYLVGFKIPKDKYINFILDYEDQLKLEQKQQQIQEQQIQEQQQIQEEQKQEDIQQEGEGKMKGGLWTNQINKIMESSKYYIDTIANNELDEILNYIYNNNILKGCFIMNTLNSYDHSVGHWVAIYYDVSNDGEYILEYYDPFGNDPDNKKLIDKFKKLFEKLNIDAYVKVKINKIKQQSISSNNCGWFSIKFLLERLNGISFKDATKYKKISKNEDDITEIKKHYNKYGFI